MLCFSKKLLLKDSTENLFNAFSEVSSLVEKRKNIAIDSSKKYHTDKHTFCQDLTAGSLHEEGFKQNIFFKEKTIKKAVPPSAPLKSDRK